MAAEESVKPVGALASRTNSTAQRHVPVGKNVSTVTTVNSAMMRTTPPVVRKKMTCKSYLMIYRIAVVTNFSKSFLKFVSFNEERCKHCYGNIQCHWHCYIS